MSSVFNTNLVFDDPYNGNYAIPGGYRYYYSWDAVVLYGAGVNFSDQQHDNNKGPNYFSYYVKHVRLVGDMSDPLILPDSNQDCKLTVVLYKCPAKYENGRLVPIHTRGFINLENYILYSDPDCVLSWGVFNERRDTRYGMLFVPYFDFSLSCNKPFYLGPNDVLCFNFFLEFGRNNQISGLKPRVNAKVVFDIN